MYIKIDDDMVSRKRNIDDIEGWLTGG